MKALNMKTEIDAPSVDSLLTGARAPEHHIRAETQCNHDRIKFVAGCGFQCAHCAADLADLE